MPNIPITNTIKAVTHPPSPLLDPGTTGIYLGGSENPISVLTLADWRTKGIGPDFCKIGRLIRYRQADLDAWIESRVKKGV